MNSISKNNRLYILSGKAALCFVLCVLLTACVRQGGNTLSTVPYGVDGSQEDVEALQREMEAEKVEALRQREKSRILLEQEKE